MKHRVVLTFAVLLAGSLPAATRAQSPMDSRPADAPTPARTIGSADVVLRPGDVLRINVWRNPDLSGDITVDADSALRHPLYRGLKVAGRPSAEVVALVRGVLLRYETEPRFVIEPLFRVPITGEVRTPNVYQLTPDVTVPQAVLMAGGASERARTRAVLIRDGRRIAVDLRHGTGVSAVTVRPGDEIVLERRSATRLWTPVTAVLSAATSLALILQWTR